MRKVLFVVMSTVVLAATVFAVEAKKPLTEAEKAALRERRLQKTGGTITVSGKGKVVFVNAQKKYSASDIETTIDPFRKYMGITMEVRPGAWKFGEKNPPDANVVIYVVDDASLPMSLVAMEAHWGIVNVAALDRNSRFERELVRVMIVTAGACVSQYKASYMQTVSAPEDLDKLVGSGHTVDATTAILGNLQNLGVTRTRMTTYRKACHEGWAPSPTNDYQRAIWKEVHELPSTPIKLTK